MDMEKRKILRTLFLTSEQDEGLREVAHAKRTSKGEIIRSLIDDYLAKELRGK